MSVHDRIKERLPFTATNSVWAIPISSCDWDRFTAICQAYELDYEIEDRTIVSTLVRMESKDYDCYYRKMRERSMGLKKGRRRS